MAKFGSDHYVELLRGSDRMSPSEVRRSLAKRAAYLARRLSVPARLQEHNWRRSILFDELRATVQVMEVYEVQHPRRE